MEQNLDFLFRLRDFFEFCPLTLAKNNNLMQVQLKSHIQACLTDAFIDAIERFQDLVHKFNQEVDKITNSDYIDVFMGNSKSLVIKQTACLSPGLNRNVAVQLTVLRVLWNKFYTFILAISKLPVVDIDEIFCVIIQTAEIQAPYFEVWKRGLGPMATLFIKQPYLDAQNCDDLQIIKVALENAEIKRMTKFKGDVNEIKSIGNQYFKNNDFISALSYYEYGLACCHKHSDSYTRAILYSNSAASLYKLNLFDNSLKYCAIAIKIDRTYYKSFAWKVHCLLEKKSFGEIPNLLVVLQSRAGADDFSKINAKYSIYLSNSLGMYNWKNICLQAKKQKSEVVVGDYFSKLIGIRMQEDRQVYYALEDIKKQTILVISKPLIFDKKGAQNMNSIYKIVVKCFQLQKSSFNSTFKQVIIPSGQTFFMKQNSHIESKSIENRIKRHLIKPRDMLSTDTQALGIWAQLIKFTHSCNPNCSVVHFDNIMLISTCTHVSYGETLTIDFATDVLPLKRKSFLLQKYNIYCKCAICEWKSWPDFSNKDEVSKVTDSLTNITMIKQVFWELMSTGYNSHQQTLLEKTTKLVIREINWADMLMAIRLIRNNNTKTGQILMQVLVAGFRTFLKVPFEFAIEMTNLIK